MTDGKQPTGRRHTAGKQVAIKKKSGGLSSLSLSFLENTTLLKRFLTRFLSRQQDIEDVIQETWLRACQAERNIEIEQPRAFLFRVARNIALNELKKKSRQMTETIADCDSRVVLKDTATLESEIEARQHLGLYCEAIATLPEKCRRVYLLRKIHGLRHKEIAERLGITVSAVEKHLLNGAVACEAYIRAREDGTDCRDKGEVHDLQASTNRGETAGKGAG